MPRCRGITGLSPGNVSASSQGPSGPLPHLSLVAQPPQASLSVLTHEMGSCEDSRKAHQAHSRPPIHLHHYPYTHVLKLRAVPAMSLPQGGSRWLGGPFQSLQPQHLLCLHLHAGIFRRAGHLRKISAGSHPKPRRNPYCRGRRTCPAGVAHNVHRICRTGQPEASLSLPN